MKASALEILNTEWCKETKRSGGVLLGASIKEFFKWVEAKTINPNHLCGDKWLNGDYNK